MASVSSHGETLGNELYNTLLNYILTAEDIKKWGFPYEHPTKPGRVTYNPLKRYKLSSDPEKQVCRCGKKVSLLQENWYVDPNGCDYLPKWLKRKKKKNAKANSNGNPPSEFFKSEYHVCCYHSLQEHEFVRASRKKKNVSVNSNAFALDTEMVYTTKGLEVAKVTVLSFPCCSVVYNTYVKPKNIVTDYNTIYSGIRLEDLAGITTTIEDVQEKLLSLFDKDSIIIGHGLENDLLGLYFLHEKVIDTSILIPHKKGFPYRQSLKRLASKCLNKSIHNPSNAHDSVEDAQICAELVLWNMNPEFKRPKKKRSRHAKKKDLMTAKEETVKNTELT
ncbi:RNA exonuclease 1-like protein, partial [Stegodyphus mimosarum]